MKPIPLTADQIKHIDTLHSDREANEATLKVALNFYKNQETHLKRNNDDWWNNLSKIHNLGLDKHTHDNNYCLESINGDVCVVKIESKT